MLLAGPGGAGVGRAVPAGGASGEGGAGGGGMMGMVFSASTTVLADSTVPAPFFYLAGAKLGRGRNAGAAAGVFG